MILDDLGADPEVEDPEFGPAAPGKPESAFRDQLSGDLVSVFLDLEFFGELHHVGGRMIRCVIDEDINHESKVAREFGITDTGFVMFARETDVERLNQGAQLEIDGRIYTVIDWRVDEGLSRVTLSRLTAY